MVEIDVKDDFLLKNEVLPCKNVTLVCKGKFLKIQRNIGLKSVFAITFYQLLNLLYLFARSLHLCRPENSRRHGRHA